MLAQRLAGSLERVLASNDSSLGAATCGVRNRAKQVIPAQFMPHNWTDALAIRRLYRWPFLSCLSCLSNGLAIVSRKELGV